jgi:hypothetical protein
MDDKDFEEIAERMVNRLGELEMFRILMGQYFENYRQNPQTAEEDLAMLNAEEGE